MINLSERAIGLVHEYLEDALQEGPLTYGAIKDGFFRAHRREILDGTIRLGDQQVERAMYELRRRGIIYEEPYETVKQGSGRPMKLWALSPTTGSSPSELKARYRDAVLCALRGRGYVLTNAASKASGLCRYDFDATSKELIRQGVLETIDVNGARSVYRALRIVDEARI